MRNKIEKSLIILVFRCTWWFWEQIVFPSKWTIRVSVSLRIVTKNIPLKSLESSGVFPTTTTVVLVNRQAIVHQLLSGGVPQLITVIITSPPSCKIGKIAKNERNERNERNEAITRRAKRALKIASKASIGVTNNWIIFAKMMHHLHHHLQLVVYVI